MNKIFVAILLIPLLLPLSAAAATITVGPANCSASAVNAAISGASEGDTIQLTCIGTVTWDSQVFLSGGKTLKGPGVKSPNPSMSGNWPLVINSTASDSVIKVTCANDQNINRVTGLKFIGGSSANFGISVTGAGVGKDDNGAFRIDNNYFDTMEVGSRLLFLDGDAGKLTGLVDHNVLYATYTKGTEGTFVGQDWKGASPTCYGYDSRNRPFVFGGSDFIFFEDNYFFDGFIETSGGGGRYVVRHNIFDSDSIHNDWNAVDGHGADTGGWHCVGVVGGEIYDNNITGVDSISFAQAFYLRGGKWLVHNNAIKSGLIILQEYRAANCLTLEFNACNGAACCEAPCGAYNIQCPTDADFARCWPLPNQINNTFIWNNIKDGNNMPTYVVETGYVRTYIVKNRDFWEPSYGPESALPSTCTADGSTFYGTTDSGKLFKCTSNNIWTLQYTPYAYPHPLTQNQSQNILPADRIIDWQPGIPGGIPNYPVGVNVKDYGVVGDGVHDDTAAIQAAVAACPVGRSVLIPAGTYRISGTINLNKGIVVRGEGPDKTKIIQYANSHIFTIVGPTTAFSWGQDHPEAGTNINITSGCSKGSDTVTLADASLAALISVGDLLWIDQLNDPELVNPVGTEDFCIWCGLGANGSRAMGEIKLVKARNGTTVQFEQPLYYNFQVQFQPRVVRITQGGTVRGAGVEDLYITWAPGVTDGAGFRFFAAAYSWVKNVESYYCPYKHVEIIASYGIEIRDSYIHEVVPGFFVGNHGYGVNIHSASTANLVENNIFYYLLAPVIVGSSGGAGNVIGYNFFEKTRIDGNPNWFMYNIGTHGAHTYMNLWEGNILNKAAFDSTHGSGSHQVVLRNYINRITNCTQVVYAVEVSALNYYLSFMGNVLGTPSCPGTVEQVPLLSFDNNPVLWVIGMSTLTGYPSDSKVNQTLIRHGNWECPTNAVQWDPSIADHNIPASLYLSSKPAFFGNLPWPAIGPDVNPMNGTIPAKLRFDSIMSGAVPGDVNGDRLVNINDLSFIGIHFGRTSSHPLWNVTADVVANNEIDIYDVVFVASRFT